MVIWKFITNSVKSMKPIKIHIMRFKLTMKIDYRYNKIKPEWILAYRARYNRWLKEPNRLVVWDVRNNVEKQMSDFELENCKIKIKYENSIKQEKQCGAKMIIEIYVRKDND